MTACRIFTYGPPRRFSVTKGGFSMSFRAVAAFMLDAVEHRAHVHEIVGLAS
jgi:hypothetical protein